jgi:transglutaminase superfamily protein/coenzyme PQQ synthesis protein D (PqqD)
MKSNGQSPVYRVAADVCFSADKDGTIILDVQGGKFHSLIQGGSRVWSVLAAHDEGITQAELVDELMDHDEEFAQEPREKVESAIQRVLEQLTRDGLLETDQSHSYSTLQRLKCLLCVAGANAIRHTGNTFIRFRGAHAAAFIEFAFYEVIRRFGGFYARQKIIRQWPIANGRRVTEQTELPALCEVVHSAAVWYPKQTLCLQKASVTTSLLRQHGFPADMKIGVRKQPFHAHAWVEVDGQVVGDHQNVRKYFREIASW